MDTAINNQLRKSIQDILKQASSPDNQMPQKYWYPLSVPSYDVEEILSAIDSLCSFRTTIGQKTSEFEQQFSSLLGSPEAIMVNSGSSADLLIAFSLVNPSSKLLKPGDEVLVPSVTWPTQIWSLMMAGLKIRFIDTDPLSLNMNLDDLESKIGNNTKAISLVHLMGNPCNMDRVISICQKHNLILIEDCCEALGARYKEKAVGTFGLAGSFSFFFSHHITTMEGGMIICNDQSLSDIYRILRDHGWARNSKYISHEISCDIDPRYLFLNWGFNVRPTELQSGFGIEQLKRLPFFSEQRKKAVKYFEKYIGSYSEVMRLMEVSPDADCSWFALPVMLTPECPFSKKDLLSYLEEQGVETRPVVAGNLTRQPAFKLFSDLKKEHLPGADAIHDRGFYLGIHPFISTKKLDRLADIFNTFVSQHI